MSPAPTPDVAARDARAVVLCGGRGTRLWPWSRPGRPKPFLSLDDGPSWLIQAVQRGASVAARPPCVVGSWADRFLLRDHLDGIALGGLILEPTPRDTAGAVALAVASTADPDEILVLLPADHVVSDERGFAQALCTAIDQARGGAIAVLGVPARGPSTAVGWMAPGDPIAPGVHALAAFHEKPDAARAAEHLAAGHRWNAGVFVGRAQVLRAALQAHAHAVWDAAEQGMAHATDDLEARLPGEAWTACPALPFDVAVMERVQGAVVVDAPAGWHDLGRWDALAEVLDPDADGNVVRGSATVRSSGRCIVHATGGAQVTAHGVHDLVIAADAGQVAVFPRGTAPRLAPGTPSEAAPPTVHRPWGRWTTRHRTAHVHVKTVHVRPQHRLSLQRHTHRDEHWVVVEGTALVTLGEHEQTLRVGDSVHVPAGTVHRLANPGPGPLEVVEVQTGPVLDEADIERLEDDYARNVSPTPR